MKALTRNRKSILESLLILYDGRNTLTFGKTRSMFIKYIKEGRSGYSGTFNGGYSKSMWNPKSFKNIEEKYVYIKNCRYFQTNIGKIRKKIIEASEDYGIEYFNEDLIDKISITNIRSNKNSKVLGIVDEYDNVSLIINNKIITLIHKSEPTPIKRKNTLIVSILILNDVEVKNGLKIKL